MIMYYLFINGKPRFFYETEEEAVDAVEDYCSLNNISIDSLDYEIKPFTEFSDEFPDPYDEYDY